MAVQGEYPSYDVTGLSHQTNHEHASVRRASLVDLTKGVIKSRSATAAIVKVIEGTQARMVLAQRTLTAGDNPLQVSVERDLIPDSSGKPSRIGAQAVIKVDLPQHDFGVHPFIRTRHEDEDLISHNAAPSQQLEMYLIRKGEVLKARYDQRNRLYGSPYPAWKEFYTEQLVQSLGEKDAAIEANRIAEEYFKRILSALETPLPGLLQHITFDPAQNEMLRAHGHASDREYAGLSKPTEEDRYLPNRPLPEYPRMQE